MIQWKLQIIDDKSSIKDALQRIEQLGIINNDLFVVNEKEELLGSLSDGDLRRATLKGIGIGESVTKAMHSSPLFGRMNKITPDLVDKCREKNIRFLPVVNDRGCIVQILDLLETQVALPVDVVLMAGGKGSRLLPLTEKVPKPLLKVGEKPIIEHNIDRLIKFGVTDFYISINYLGHLLKQYFGDGSAKQAKIEYICEEKPMGTIGSVKLHNNYQSEALLIMNADLLTNINFSDFYKAFITSDADMCVATTSYTVEVPYAVLEVTDNSRVTSLREKPSYTFHSNAGIYIIKKKILDLIPVDSFFDITDLMENLISSGMKVHSFPIIGYWLDIGKKDDYYRAQEDIKYLKL